MLEVAILKDTVFLKTGHNQDCDEFIEQPKMFMSKIELNHHKYISFLKNISRVLAVDFCREHTELAILASEALLREKKRNSKKMVHSIEPGTSTIQV